jgi:uncharacterized protein
MHSFFHWLNAAVRRFHALYGLPLAWVVIGTAQAQSPQLDLPRATLQAGLYRIDAQVASTPSQREIGLMFRREMPAHEGMLFVFEQASAYCFWMKNTPLPLSAAFIDDQGRVVNVVEMQAKTTVPHCAKAPVRYVLEMNLGWFAQRRIDTGFALKGPMWSAQ